MISRDMYRVLKMIPRAPGNITFKDMLGTSKRKLKRINEIFSVLEDAQVAKYIEFSSPNPYSKLTKSAYCLTELGQIEIEEYKHRKLDSRRSLWAIIISIIALITSTAISLLSYFSQCSVG